jgi:DNA-binding transcriptional MerR regulator
MKYYTVKDVAKLSGVSVRALHHYDEIGLLKPACVGENGYRYYGREELLRLQQILFHRELEFPLEAIAAVLASPDFDRVEALRRHRVKLAAEATRYRRLLKTLDTTLAALNGETEMNENDIYEGFAPERQAEYEAWLVDRFGGEMPAHLAFSKQTMKGWSKADQAAFQAELAAIERGMGEALRLGVPADSAAVDPLMRRHHAWVALSWKRPPSAEAFAGLADLYLAHEDFKAHYEAVEPGLAEYMAAAMKGYAARALG